MFMWIQILKSEEYNNWHIQGNNQIIVAYFVQQLLEEEEENYIFFFNTS